MRINLIRSLFVLGAATLSLSAQTGTATPPVNPGTTTSQPPATPPSSTQSTPQTAPPLAPWIPSTVPNEPLSFELRYWITSGVSAPILRGGQANVESAPSNLDFPGGATSSPEAVLRIPMGKTDALSISYFLLKGSGNVSAPEDLTLFSTAYVTGDYLVTRYTMQNMRISYEGLIYPFPRRGAKLEIKTLYEVQGTQIKSTIDAPLKAVATDSSGDIISNTASGNRYVIYPLLGAVIQHHPFRNFRWEVRGSGFAFPHRAVTWNAEASAMLRVRRAEIVAGYQTFHVKTSPLSDQYFSATFTAPYAGLRWDFH